MSAPWLSLVGMGADGLPGLAPASRAAVEAAEVLVGGARHHALTENLAAPERLEWPRPFSAMPARLAALRGRRVAVLLTGDPLWCSAGSRVAAAFAPEDLAIHPHPSAFQLAAARMGWPLETAETLSLHGRAVEGVLAALAPGARLLILSADGATPGAVAAFLTAAGYGDSVLTVLADMGAASESRISASAADWSGAPPAFHTLAVACLAAPGAALISRLPGLPDDAYRHDGKMTKRELRALTISRLAPAPGARLWDIGAGCGSVAIEWMRAARGCTAVGVEPSAARRSLAAANAAALGAPGLRLVAGRAPEALAGLPPPDAVFVGGGLSDAVAASAMDALPPGGRLVANAVTLESEARLSALQAERGGDLVRVAVQRARPVGPYRGWEAAMPVTQWCWVKR